MCYGSAVSVLIDWAPVAVVAFAMLAMVYGVGDFFWQGLRSKKKSESILGDPLEGPPD